MHTISLLIGLFFGAPLSIPASIAPAPLLFSEESFRAEQLSLTTGDSTRVPDVPFYSQFQDIHAKEWQKIGCGIASLAMIIEYYHPKVVSVDTLLHEAIESGAYAKNAGWKHRDLALLGKQYGLEGESYDLSHVDADTAFTEFEKFIKDGPVIASVHYKFDPQSTIPHLVVINGIKGDYLFVNDPAEPQAGKEISIADFMKAWKKRFIVLKPEEPVL